MINVQIGLENLLNHGDEIDDLLQASIDRLKTACRETHIDVDACLAMPIEEIVFLTRHYDVGITDLTAILEFLMDQLDQLAASFDSSNEFQLH